MNPLAGALSPRIRKVLYAVFGLLALVISAIRVAFDSIDHILPTWLVASSTAVTFLATAFAALAVSNIPAPPSDLEAQRRLARRAMPADLHGADPDDHHWGPA